MTESFRDRNLAKSKFENVSLEAATFEDVKLVEATFTNVALTGARFSDVNLSGVSITNANLEGMTIDGFDVRALIDAEKGAPSILTDEPLANPERDWERRAELGSIDAAALERHLGERLDQAFVVLSGGLANTNVRIGSRVVRIYRRDPSGAAREALLLSHEWKTFRVPRLLRQAPGVLVLEYVEHRPVLGNFEHGYAVGRALAEIHSTRIDVGERFDDLVGALVEYAQNGLSAEASRLLTALAPRLREVAGPPVLLHADFKASNLHWAADDRLLILDWEFAYEGSALSDIGQLLRWDPPAKFIDAFASGYRAGGGHLIDDWPRWAAAFDLINLAGLVANQSDVDSPHRVRDVSQRIDTTLALFAHR